MAGTAGILAGCNAVMSESFTKTLYSLGLFGKEIRGRAVGWFGERELGVQTACRGEVMRSWSFFGLIDMARKSMQSINLQIKKSTDILNILFSY
jgi:hypothetical protein